MNRMIPTQLVLERREKVWNLRLQGYTYEAIGKELGISHAAVAKILLRVAKRYNERHVKDVDRIKAEQMAQLENVAFEAWKAWQRSVDNAGSTYDENGNKIAYIDGDPRYLQVYLKAKEDIRKVCGAYYIPKFEGQIKINVSELTLEERIKFFDGMKLNDQIAMIEGLMLKVQQQEQEKADADVKMLQNDNHSI